MDLSHVRLIVHRSNGSSNSRKLIWVDRMAHNWSYSHNWWLPAAAPGKHHYHRLIIIIGLGRWRVFSNSSPRSRSTLVTSMTQLLVIIVDASWHFNLPCATPAVVVFVVAKIVSRDSTLGAISAKQFVFAFRLWGKKLRPKCDYNRLWLRSRCDLIARWVGQQKGRYEARINRLMIIRNIAYHYHYHGLVQYRGRWGNMP